MNKIVAVVGLCGSGKSEAVKFFMESGWSKVYFGDVVMNEVKLRGLEVNEKNERYIREDLRKQYGMAAMAVKSIEMIKKLFAVGNVVIESLYSWAEFKIIKDEFGDEFKLLTIHTSKELRYQRLQYREIRPLNLEEAISRDFSEIENLEKGGPIAFCDYLIENNKTLEDLKRNLLSIIEE